MINTLKRDRLSKEILNPENKTMLEAGTKAGYTSKQIYRKSTKKHLAEIFKAQGVTKESLKEAYEDCLTLCKTKGDLSTLKATIDSLGRLFGHLKDNTQIQVNQIDVDSELRARRVKPVDNCPIVTNDTPTP